MHTMHRGLMSRVFTPRRMAALEDQVREFCVGCLDPLVGSDGFDIVAELGVDAADAGHRHAARHPRAGPGRGPRPDRRQPAHRAGRADGGEAGERRQRRHVRRLHRLARRAPVRRPHDRAPQRRVRGRARRDRARSPARRCSPTPRSSPAPATRPPAGSSAGSAKVLAEHPDQRRQVVEDRSLIPKVDRRDAALRADRARHRRATSRRTSSTTARPSRPAAPILLLVGSANRDPRRYTDPDVFDIHREDIQHLTFGYGAALLPRRQPRPARRPRRARRAPEPLPRVGRRPTGAELAPTSTVRGWERLPIVLS